MEKIPEDRDARLGFLEEWAKGQNGRLYTEEIARVVAQARERLGQMDFSGAVAAIPVVVTKPSQLPADREAVFADLMVRLREYEWADPIVSECDELRHVAPSAIELARRHRPDAPWLLYMEDDVILGPDFGLLPGLLSEADELFPHTEVVSFFSLPFEEPGWSIHPMEDFGSLLCAAIRNSDHLGGLRDFIDHGVTQSAGTQLTTSRTPYEFPDIAVGAFLAVECDAYALWCPSLVQHSDVTSAIWGTTGSTRISTSYERAYG